MRTQTIKVKNKKGRPVLYGSAESFRWDINDGVTIEGKLSPTFGYKLRRFFRRLAEVVDAQLYKTLGAEFYSEPTSDGEPTFRLVEGREYE